MIMGVGLSHIRCVKEHGETFSFIVGVCVVVPIDTEVVRLRVSNGGATVTILVNMIY